MPWLTDSKCHDWLTRNGPINANCNHSGSLDYKEFTAAIRSCKAGNSTARWAWNHEVCSKIMNFVVKIMKFCSKNHEVLYSKWWILYSKWWILCLKWALRRGAEGCIRHRRQGRRRRSINLWAHSIRVWHRSTVSAGTMWFWRLRIRFRALDPGHLPRGRGKTMKLNWL